MLGETDLNNLVSCSGWSMAFKIKYLKDLVIRNEFNVWKVIFQHKTSFFSFSSVQLFLICLKAL